MHNTTGTGVSLKTGAPDFTGGAPEAMAKPMSPADEQAHQERAALAAYIEGLRHDYELVSAAISAHQDALAALHTRRNMIERALSVLGEEQADGPPVPTQARF